MSSLRTRRDVLVSAVGALVTGASAAAAERKGSMLDLNARSREAAPDGAFVVREKPLRWDPAQAAVIICDMWDHHWCKGAEQRVGELAPHVDAFVSEARGRGALVVHAPSACLE